MSDISISTDLLNLPCHQKGVEPDQVTTFYDDWATDYDEFLSPGTYNGPQIALEEIMSHVPADLCSTLRVLDVAAGTGLVGVILAGAGFRLLDAVEPSLGMIKILQEKKVYQNIFQVYMGIKDPMIPPDTYDLVIAVGGMAEGHLPITSVDDMITACKPGGFVVIAMRYEFLQNTEAYRGKLLPYMDSLEGRGCWKMATLLAEYQHIAY
ncbi:methyltransferase-like protein 27 [Portunus trituberculatus]|uniref:methyltransferase-like protein 27 n=1 Tax=Portunus trituberculatus TaxID=210409 RepID=UPI001E1D0924|nr:methyltransferase-like protein 27 [Portunus trituberculatus]